MCFCANPAFRVLLSASFGIALALGPAHALESDANIGFTATGINPWTGHPSSEVYYDRNYGVDLSFDVPPVGASPGDILADFLGLDVDILSAKIGGSAHVSAGLDIGYYAADGRLSLSYPGLAKLNIETSGSDNHAVKATGFNIDTSFGAGLSQLFVPTSVSALGTIGGDGYTDPSIQGFFGGEVFRAPHFATTFPSVSAWADLYVDASVSAFVEAKGLDLPFIGCIACVRKDFKVASGYHTVPLAEIDPGNVIVAGIGGIQLDQPFGVAPGLTVTPSFPNLKVAGTLVPGTTTVAGSDSKPFVTVQGNLDELVPFVGPFLSGSIGPFGYNLASLQGGPSVGLYQDLSFSVTPKVRLDFSELVNVSVGGGAYHAMDSVLFDLGQSIRIDPLVSNHGDLTISPTYLLDNTFTNETGLSLDVAFDLLGPSLTSSFGNLGPIGHESQIYNLAQIPISTTSFSIPVGQITPEPITLHKSLLAGIYGAEMEVTGYQVLRTNDDGDLLRLTFLDPQTGWTGSADVIGTQSLVPILGGQDYQTVFTAADDVLLSLPVGLFNPTLTGLLQFNAGDTFCLGCLDLTALFDPTSPYFTDGGDKLFISKLPDLPDPYCDACNPILSQQTEFASGGPVETFIGPTVRIAAAPEPTTWSILAAGLCGLAMRRRTRRRI